jgi:hypothetical protein
MELVCSLVSQSPSQSGKQSVSQPASQSASQSVSKSVGFKDLPSHNAPTSCGYIPVYSLIPTFTTAVLRMRENSSL